MLGEIGDTAQIRTNGMLRVVAELQIFQHALTQGCHARAYGPHERTPSGEKVTITAWMSRRSRKSHCGRDSCERLDGRDDGGDGRGERNFTRTQ
jgi:hypothetical protein